ncbi:hypothetical protein Q1695_009048 [Nippostrongylus brasiliensis]|nr:hypothetical protein Q1695_009048 [Nippostrongylus brasiliensis]
MLVRRRAGRGADDDSTIGQKATPALPNDSSNHPADRLRSIAACNGLGLTKATTSLQVFSVGRCLHLNRKRLEAILVAPDGAKWTGTREKEIVQNEVKRPSGSITSIR